MRTVTRSAAILAAALLLAGCASSESSSTPAASAPAAKGQPAPGWIQPGADLRNTRDVASAIAGSNVSKLGVAWTVPIPVSSDTAGDYATTPVVQNGVVYTQDLQSDVLAIRLATGQVLWRHDYGSPNGGPDGVTVAGGVVYAATDRAAVALDAATGRPLWSRTLIRNDHEGIDMAPGFDHGTVYVSTVPVQPAAKSEYAGGAGSVLWALNGKTGAPEWSWDEVQDLWGNPSVNSGGGLWDPPSFDGQGNLYIGIANPAPLGGTPRYPWGTSRPGPDLYTDSVVKLSPQGQLLWYYQLTPHDLYDWDLQNSPVLTTAASGRPVVIAGGKAGILVELDARTGKLLWKRPVGTHNGHDNDGLLTEHSSPSAQLPLSAQLTVEPGAFGGIESQLASNGSTVFAAVNDLPYPISSTRGYTGSLAAVLTATGEMVAVDQDTGQIEWDTDLPSSPYGAAAVTNGLVFTTTFGGDLDALDAATGAVVWTTPMSAGSNAPVAIDGDYVIAGAGAPLSASQKSLIIAYKLGAHGKLPDTVGA
jgi:outer membrane protein assembly factor BamB